MIWQDFVASIPQMPDTERAARATYRAFIAALPRDWTEDERASALSMLGDTWGEAARFRGWTL